jgi:hypothetical protein
LRNSPTFEVNSNQFHSSLFPTFTGLPIQPASFASAIPLCQYSEIERYPFESLLRNPLGDGV